MPRARLRRHLPAPKRQRQPAGPRPSPHRSDLPGSDHDPFAFVTPLAVAVLQQQSIREKLGAY